MILKTIKYNQFLTEPRKWVLNELVLNKINLIVGKNSSGKSKSLNVINGLSNLLSDNFPIFISEGENEVKIEINNKEFHYILNIHNGIVQKEYLYIDETLMLSRDIGSINYIISDNKSKHEFEIPDNELKVTRRDKKNYPYLEDLHNWATHVRMFNLSGHAGKGSLAIKDPNKLPSKYALKNTDLGTITAFLEGAKLFPKEFIPNVIKDFNSIGYNIENIELGSLMSVNFQIIDNPNAVSQCLRVKEKDLDCVTDQFDMSNGMYSALSILIHFNLYNLMNLNGVVLLDDIGEGLDNERSIELINLLIKKTEEQSNLQLIMTTNNSFIMNNVDLKYWQIIDRSGCNVNFYNIKNSKQTFDEYKFTGLNNFDFFSTGFFKTGFEEEL